MSFEVVTKILLQDEREERFPDSASTVNNAVFDPILIAKSGSDRTLFVKIQRGSSVTIPRASNCALGARIILTGEGSSTSCPTAILNADFTIINPDTPQTPNFQYRIHTQDNDVLSSSPLPTFYTESNRLLIGFVDPYFFVELERIILPCGSPFWLWRNHNEQFDVCNALERIKALYSWKGTINSNLSTLQSNYTALNSRVTNIDNNTLKKGKGIETAFYNTVHLPYSSLTITKEHHKILARQTARGYSNLTFYFGRELPIGLEIIIMLQDGCNVNISLPSGTETYGYPTTRFTTKGRYVITKSHTNEWVIEKFSYVQ